MSAMFFFYMKLRFCSIILIQKQKYVKFTKKIKEKKFTLHFKYFYYYVVSFFFLFFNSNKFWVDIYTSFPNRTCFFWIFKLIDT